MKLSMGILVVANMVIMCDVALAERAELLLGTWTCDGVREYDDER